MSSKAFYYCITWMLVHAHAFAQDVPEKDLTGLYPHDWLIRPVAVKAGLYTFNEGKDIVLYNGLLKRTFRTSPNLACIDFKNMSSGQQLLRSVKAEARLVIDGRTYNIGGLYGQKENGYLLPEWVDGFTANRNDFQYERYVVSELDPYIRWKPARWAMNKKQATGKQVTFYFKAPVPELDGLVVAVNYAIYDGLPLIVKWLTVENKTDHSVMLDRVVNEILGIVEEESDVDGDAGHLKNQHGIFIETNYSFNNTGHGDLSDQITHWKPDSTYTSQVNYRYQTPCLLEIYPEKSGSIELSAGGTFRSVRTHELLMDSYDRERRGLAIRKMYRTINPWVTENPIFMHLVSKNDQEVKTAIDQCVATGYEMVILSFGSHCNMEDTSAANIFKWKSWAEYAHAKGVQIGGYSLFSSRRISDEDDVIDPATGKPDAAAIFGSAPCLGSKWGLSYLEKLKYFISRTGFDLLEHDGPYPGDLCASTTHPGHRGVGDSQWAQTELQKELYHWCNERGVYVNAPDWYFMDGTNKTSLGYREVNFSLPRAQQKILNRQNIYDGTWNKLVSQSWGFVPLTEYQGGGSEAVLEPLHDHLADYEQLMMQYYGAGIQACYRGPRLYDTDSTRKAVVKVIGWYKKYRDILNGDIIHLRRPDGKDWDGILHVSSNLKIRGLMMLYNPTKEKITRTISVPLYYTGADSTVFVREQEGRRETHTLDRDRTFRLNVNLDPGRYSWWVIE